MESTIKRNLSAHTNCVSTYCAQILKLFTGGGGAIKLLYLPPSTKVLQGSNWGWFSDIFSQNVG